MHEYSLIGRGAYNIAEVARLSEVPASRIRRWCRGYSFDDRRGERRFSPPIIGSGIEEPDESRVLTFADLMEIRFLNAFRCEGVSWKTIRLVAAKVRDALMRTHPFANRLFRTDGRTILLELISEDFSDHRLMDLVGDQYEWEKLVGPHLLKRRVEFDDSDEPMRWWPLGGDRHVVVDPRRAFGAPIVADEGVHTYQLSKAVAVEGDVDYVADWFEVSTDAVLDAVEFENGLRPAA